MDERRKLINQDSKTGHLDLEDEWSESSYSSYYSDSDSSVPEWDSSVDERTGEVLYIECHPFVTQNISGSNKAKDHSFSKTQARQSTRGKFLKLIRRRESKRYSKRNNKNPIQLETHNTNKVKFQDFEEGEEREVTLQVITRHRPNPENLLIESLLGINISTLSDGNRLMIAGFLPDSSAKYEKSIKIGDWLKSIDGIDINFTNLNNILQQIYDKTEVLLKLQRVAGVDVTKEPPINELNNQSSFVRQLISFNLETELLLSEKLCKFPLGVLYLNPEMLTENGPEFEDVTYCYPHPMQKNILCNTRGIFTTLNHLIYDITKRKTNVTSLMWRDKLCHVTYTQFDNKIFLLMLPDSCAKSKAITLITEDILRMLTFCYNSIEECFSSTNDIVTQQIDHYFSKFFTRVLSGGSWIPPQKFLEENSLPICAELGFEDLLPAAQMLSLPNEATMQIDDALTDLEACDYREWNEEPLDCQRLYTMLGSAWYHSGYLLASHLIYEDLVDVHSYCRQQGLLHLSKTEPVKNLVFWKHVYPTSCRHLDNVNYKLPDAQRYLLIVGNAKDLLAVIMEAGGCTEPPEDNAAPDPFYVEEAQATLAHLQELGLSEVADRFIAMNPGPQVTLPMASNRKKPDMMNLTKMTHQVAHRDPFSAIKKHEVTSILKRRNPDQTQTYNSSFALSDDYDAHSEDTESQGGYSEKSEVSDEPVAAGKRTTERRVKYDSGDDDSEIEENVDGSQMSNNSFDVSELRQLLLTETEDIQPMQLTAGDENVLYHFVQFDKMEGILISPPECTVESQTRDAIIANFRHACHKIHCLFQNTIRFKNMPSQEMSKSVMNKSLIAIKEYGMMFECPFLDDKDSKKHRINYWVVGRLFFNPQVRELYVCYNDAIPQNLIEVAFNLNLGYPNNASHK